MDTHTRARTNTDIQQNPRKCMNTCLPLRIHIRILTRVVTWEACTSCSYKEHKEQVSKKMSHECNSLLRKWYQLRLRWIMRRPETGCFLRLHHHIIASPKPLQVHELLRSTTLFTVIQELLTAGPGPFTLDLPDTCCSELAQDQHRGELVEKGQTEFKATQTFTLN